MMAGLALILTIVLPGEGSASFVGSEILYEVGREPRGVVESKRFVVGAGPEAVAPGS